MLAFGPVLGQAAPGKSGFAALGGDRCARGGMLRITQQTSSEAAKDYYASADYYTEGQEIVGRWGGEGAKMLGLEGRVESKEFNRLCENRHPHSGEALTARTRDDRTVGYDFTFSVPKSVSLFYAWTEDQDVLAAFRASVHETMQDMEKEMKVRVRKDGSNSERVTGNILYGEFIHFTSRPVDGVPDPQLHAHCFVFNATHDAEEQAWKAGQFRDLKRDAPFWQAAFRARLANHLQALGWGIERKRDDFELSGIPTTAIKRFSRRTTKIEELAEKEGITDPNKKALLGAKTRERKDKNLSWAELRREWASRLAPEEMQALVDVEARRGTNQLPEHADDAAVDFATRHVLCREAVTPERRVLAEALKHGLGRVSVEGVQESLAKKPLLFADHNGRKMLTSPKLLAEEDRLVAFARNGRGTLRALGKKDRPFKRDWLNADQKRAVRHVLSSRDRVMMIRGAAGTGKTRLMQEAVEGIEESGHLVTVLAPSSTAARDVLREDFADSETVAMFLKDPKMQAQAEGQVIWVDEAGLMGSHDMAALFNVAERIKARVILMGDRKQHGSVAYGTPLKLLEQEAGVPVVAVRKIVRQEHDAYKHAVRLLADGKIAQGFDALDKLGWIQEVQGNERYQLLAEGYLAAASEKKADGKFKSALVVSPTHAEGARITEAIRKELAARGELVDEHAFKAWIPVHLSDAERGEAENYEPGYMLQFHQNAKGVKRGGRLIAGTAPLPLDQAARFQVFRPTTLQLAIGDRLRVTANGKTADGRHRLNNGALFSIAGFTKEGDIIVDNGWTINQHFGHVAHGYVVTSHASQGKTVENVLIGQSSQSLPATSREGFYVEASRGKEKVMVFTDDKKALREAAVRGREKLTVTEVFRPKTAPAREQLERYMSQLRRSASAVPLREPTVHTQHLKELIYDR